MADLCLVFGYLLAVVGVALTFGAGPACIVAGVVLFLAGGLQARKVKRAESS